VSGRNQPGYKGIGCELRIGLRHRIAAQNEPTPWAVAQQTVQEKTPFACSENNVSGPNLAHSALLNLCNISRPERWEHALPVNAESQPSPDPQSFCKQSGTLGATNILPDIH
jgi:hypothetical protein